MEKALKKKAKDIMTKAVIAVEENESLKNIFQLMDRHGILGLPVVDGKRHVVGMITETDLIGHFTTLKAPRSVNLLGGIVYLDSVEDFNEKLKDHCAEYAKDMMTSPVITANEEDSLLDLINTMADKGLSRLPVVNGKHELTGIITRSDIIHHLAGIKIV